LSVSFLPSTRLYFSSIAWSFYSSFFLSSALIVLELCLLSSGALGST